MLIIAANDFPDTTNVEEISNFLKTHKWSFFKKEEEKKEEEDDNNDSPHLLDWHAYTGKIIPV